MHDSMDWIHVCMSNGWACEVTCCYFHQCMCNAGCYEFAPWTPTLQHQFAKNWDCQLSISQCTQLNLGSVHSWECIMPCPRVLFGDVLPMYCMMIVHVFLWLSIFVLWLRACLRSAFARASNLEAASEVPQVTGNNFKWLSMVRMYLNFVGPLWFQV